MTVYGHQTIYQSFIQSPQSALGQPYCFIGSPQVGKMHTAVSIAAVLLPKTEGKNILNHPDLWIVQQEKNAKTGKTKKHIDLAQIQDLQQFITRNSALGGARIAIIDQAELCHEQAQQALLKTIEELPNQVMVIFLIPDREVLLPTILSRCQNISFASLSADQMKEFAQSIGCTNKDMIAQAHGRPGRLYAWMQSDEVYAEYLQQKKEFTLLFRKSFSEKIAAVELLFGKKEDHIATRSALIDRLDCWLEVCWEQMQVESNPQTMVTLVQVIAQTRFQLLKNIHPRLLIEQILLHIP